MTRIRSTFHALLPFLVLACLALPGCTSMLTHFGGGVSEELQKSGVVAKARIEEIWDTGWTINDNPVIGMKVLVLPADRPAFEATIEKTTISLIAIPQFQPGNTVQSTAIANVRVEQRGRGQLAEAQSVGWLARYFLSLWPI